MQDAAGKLLLPRSIAYIAGGAIGGSLQSSQSVIQAIQKPTIKVDIASFDKSSFFSKVNVKNALIAAVLAMVLVLISAGAHSELR